MGPLIKRAGMIMTNEQRDRIIDLIKLANKNDNENEANSAARLVCELLADHTFIYDGNKDFDYSKWCQRHRKPKSVCGCK